MTEQEYWDCKDQFRETLEKMKDDFINQLEVFYSNYKDVDKSKLFKRILKEKIDTSKVSLDEIVFLNFNDSLTTNKNLKSSKLDLKKINFPEGTIFIGEKDELIDYGINPIKISLSRVVFNHNINFILK